LMIILSILLLESTFCLTDVSSNLASIHLPPKVPVEPFCNKNVLAAFQFKGRSHPSPDPLLLCPEITLSCCAKTDQIVLYENFIERKEETEMTRRFKYIQDIYEEFLASTTTVHKLAARLLKKYGYKKISNCKIFSQRVEKFETEKIFPRLKIALKQMHNFYTHSYKGVYCAVCDAHNHQYFDLANPDKMEIHFSQKFWTDLKRDKSAITINLLLRKATCPC